MTPEQRRWLRRARKLAAGVQRKFEALEPDLDGVEALEDHIETLLSRSEWHGETLDTFLKDMLPLADCCAALEARLPSGGNARYTLQRSLHLVLAAEVGTISVQLLAALDRYCLFDLDYTPPQEFVNRLALSGWVGVGWWPRALRATAEAEVGQGTQPSGVAPPNVKPRWGKNLLEMAGQAAKAILLALEFIHGQQ